MSTLTKEQLMIEKISPSALMAYEECPKLFYYNYWLGLKLPTDQRHLQFGTAYHEAIENIYSQYDDNFGNGWALATVSLAIKRFKELFTLDCITDEEFQNVLQMKTNKHATKEDLFNSMQEDGIRMIKLYWKEKERLLVEHNIDITECEIPMKIDIVNPSNPEEKLPIPLSLRIDGRTRMFRSIVEHKTSAGLYDEIETREKFQGRCYAYAHWRQKGVLPDKVIYVVNIKNKPEEKGYIQVIELKYDMADMQKLYHDIEVILQRIANREFGAGKVGGFQKRDLDKYEKALGIIS